MNTKSAQHKNALDRQAEHESERTVDCVERIDIARVDDGGPAIGIGAADDDAVLLRIIRRHRLARRPRVHYVCAPRPTSADLTRKHAVLRKLTGDSVENRADAPICASVCGSARQRQC